LRKLAGEVLDFVAPHVKPGITTGELDSLCHHLIVDEQKAIPAPLNYAPLPGCRGRTGGEPMCRSTSGRAC